MKEFRKTLFDILNVNKSKKPFILKIYNIFIILITIISLLSLCVKEYYSAFAVIDIIAGIAFTIDYVFRWLTADYKYKYKNITAQKAFLIYPFRFHAIVDLLAIISTLPAFFGSMRAVQLIAIFRIIKCSRVFKLFKYSTSFDIIYVILQKQKKVLLTVFFIALFYIFISALIVFQIEPDTFETFFDAIYWSVISLTTVGYGDLYPSSEPGRLFSMISAFFGIAFIALPAGIISAGYLEVIMERRGTDKKE